MRAFAIVVFVTLTLAATAPARVVSFGDEPSAALPEYDVAGDAKDGTVLADVRDYFEERSYDWALEAYVELWNKQRVLFFERLPQGETVVRYRLRAEVPGTYTALPACAAPVKTRRVLACIRNGRMLLSR